MMAKNPEEFRRAWIRRNRVIVLCFGLGLTSLLLLLLTVLHLSIYWFTFLPIAALLTWWTERKLKPTQGSSISYLHNNYPEFEFSLRNHPDKEDLPLLAQLQKDKIQRRFESTELFLPASKPIVARLSAVAGLLLVLPLVFGLIPNEAEKRAPSISYDQKEDEVSYLRPDSAHVDNLKLNVKPPKYTQSRAYTSKNLDQIIPEGSDLLWSFKRRGGVESVDFRVGERQELIPAEVEQVKYSAQKSFLYYYVVNDSMKQSKSSPFYSITVEEDQPPRAELSEIEEYQKLPWKESYDIEFEIDLADDYGMQEAYLSATVAKGSGESVKFREKRFELSGFKSGSRSYTGRYQFTTKDFDMEPGSELYFYVMVRDNCPFRRQSVKTTTHFVVLEDTASYQYMDDAGMQVDLMPDFFRSQRQIIIDTEKLIEEHGRISEQAFKKRSNELGFDQKMLRLKYGQFLGEEAESGIAIENEIEEGHDHEGDHGHEEGEEVDMEDVLNQYGHAHDQEAEDGDLLSTKGLSKQDPQSPSWVEELTHSHDNAEEHTYFEASLKTKLKAALSLMWDSELHLRLFQPDKALPYQYRTLEFLEEIKNSARVYVHRIGFDPPAIKVAEKRLTGEQKDILDPSSISEKKEFIDRNKSKVFIEHFSGIEQREFVTLEAEDRVLLEAVGVELAQVAIENPSLMETLTLIRDILNSNPPIRGSQLVYLRKGILRSMPEAGVEIRRETQVFHPINAKALKVLRESK